ncbi:trafficking protein particle complex subunit 1 [Neocloeon triangulifer]|uniref:trafficking protein particle complex subunit 1 n=1 Tax=Neocloeon triangulifer TaxID=2078957 RepID=UPI00286F14B4|nr:trafficking protein particle complex subunit 1 [Neocloeon triangulifer]
MKIYNLYIFNNSGTLLHYAEWNRTKQSGITREHEAKLMYGMLFSIKSFVAKMSLTDTKDGFLCYRTNKYALHFYETPTGNKFVLNTDATAGRMTDFLKNLNSQIFVEYVVKNPTIDLKQPIKSDLFSAKLDAFIKSSPLYVS